MPEILDREIRANASLYGLAEAFEQSDQEILLFPAEDKSVVEAIVISSDEGGNFYKTLVVQDDWENPGMGLMVKIDLRAYYLRYTPGRKIFLRLAGLAMGKENGLYVLGYLHRQRVEPIPKPLLDDFIVVSSERKEVQPAMLYTQDLEMRHLLTSVRLQSLQFAMEELGKTYAGERYDNYTALRSMKVCEEGFELDLINSTYADFKTMLLPEGRFDIEGILTLGRHDGLGMEIISPESLTPVEGQRCDPEMLDCPPADIQDAKLIFFEGFDDLLNTAGLEQKGWTNVNMSFQNEKFRKRSENGNTFLRISAYGSQELTMEAWLVSPPLDLDDSQNEWLSFDTRATFQEGRALSVWISRDYGSDPLEASWEQLDCAISDGSADGSNKMFKSSGKISLSCVEGTIRLGFRYQGGDPGISTNYDLDNILVMGQLLE